MKRHLTKIINNKVIDSIAKFYNKNETIILTGSNITLSVATTAIVFRNSPKIHKIIFETKDILINKELTEKEKKDLYKNTIEELAPLILPIIMFQSATIGTAIISKKKSDLKDKKISELTSAMSVAIQAIDHYKEFQKEAEEQLGDKKITKIRESITNKGEPVYTSIQLNPGEIIFKDRYCGHVFKGTKDTVRLACERMSQELYEDDCTILNWAYYNTLGVDDTCELGEHWGYYSNDGRINITPQFMSTEIFVNGTLTPGYEVWLNPSPSYIDK